jgi:UPF0755 protein
LDVKSGLYRIVVVLVLLGWILADCRYSLDAPLNLSGPWTLHLRKGEGIRMLGHRLKAEGVLQEPIWLMLLSYVSGNSRSLKYGDYLLNPGLTPRLLLEQLVSGKARQVPVTFIEGMRFRDALGLLSHHPILRQEIQGRSPEEIMKLLGEEGVPAEGAFFPDTYFTSAETSDLDILRKARRKMQSVLLAEWEGRDPKVPYTSAYEALVMASIVEKETGLSAERPAIAGVFVRRLYRGMRLQTDPTVIYGLGETFDGDLKKEDLRRDTPFNTYLRAGLPPTPIALPGREAIHAAMHPEVGQALYFVAKGNGAHVFSDTLEAHEKAVDQFQRHPNRESQVHHP